MAYQPPPQGGYPPYGAPPPGQSPQPPYQQYGAPPPQQPQYGAPPPGQSPQPPYQQYGAPPQAGYPAQQSYGAPAPAAYGAPPPQQYPQQGAYPPQQPAYGAPPPQQYPPQQYGSPAPPAGAYGAPPPQQYPPQQYPPQQYPPQQYPPQQAYGAPAQPYVQPAPPSPGYGPMTQIQWDGSRDADACRKAMKGFGTDEKALIRALADKDPLQVHAISTAYTRSHKRSLINDVKSEVGGHLEAGLCAIIRGPLMQDVVLLHDAMDGPGTKEKILNDVLLGRSNADMKAIKEAYRKTYHTALETAIKADLSMKTERHFLMVLAANRNEESTPVIPQQIDSDVMEIYKATEGTAGTDELLVCSILTQRSDAQIRAIAHTYQQKFTTDLETVIKKEFSGHMELALLHQLRTGTDKAMRDVLLLEDTMAGAGTKDALLMNRVVRVHWDRNHMQQVKGAYQHRFHKSLTSRMRGETSGDFETLLCACFLE